MNLKEAKQNLCRGNIEALEAQLDTEPSQTDRDLNISNLCAIAITFFGHVDYRAIKFLFNLGGKEFTGCKNYCKELFNIACDFSDTREVDVSEILVSASYI